MERGSGAKATGKEPCCIKESALQSVLKWTNKDTVLQEPGLSPGQIGTGPAQQQIFKSRNLL